MRIAIILTILLSNFLIAAYNPSASVKDEDFSDDPAVIILNNVKIEDDIDVANDYIGANPTKDQIKKTKQEIKEHRDFLKNRKDISINYFIDYFEYSEASELLCPPLKENYKGIYESIVDNINFQTGAITCSVYQNPFYNKGYSKRVENAFIKPKITRIFTKTFYNKEYIQHLKNQDDVGSLIDEKAITASELYKDKLAAAKTALKYKYNNSSTNYSLVFNNQDNSNDITYLDFSDVIDAVMTFNTNIIDLQASFNTNSLVFRDGYFVNYLDENRYQVAKERKEKLNQISRELNQQYDFFPTFFEPNKIKEVEEERSEVQKLLGDKLNMIIYFIVKYHELFTYIFAVFIWSAMLLMIYNIINYFSSQKEINKLHVTVMSISIFFIFFMNVQFQRDHVLDESNDRTYNIETSRVQDLVNVLSVESNFIADAAAEAIIDSFTNSLFSSVSLTSEQIKYVAKDYLRNEFIKENLSNTLSICYKTFDSNLLKNDNELFFKNLKNKTNFIPDEIASKRLNRSIYNTTKNDGYVKNISLFDQSKLSLNVCSSSEKLLDAITQKIKYSKKRIDAFNDLEVKDKVYLQKQLYIERIYDDFFKLGYISAPFLAVMNSYQKISLLPQKKAEEWSNLILNFDVNELTNFAAENWVLMLIIGEPVKEFVSGISKMATDGLIGWVPLIGEVFSGIASQATGYIAATLFVDLLYELLPALTGLFIWAIASIWFFVMFLSKFVVFWLLPFTIMVAIATDSVQKFSRIIIKTIITFIKPTILIFILFITLFTLDFFSNFTHLFLDQMVDDLSAGTIQTFGAHILLSATKLLTIGIEFVVGFMLITRGYKSIIAFFELNSSDLADDIIDNVSNVIQNKAIR